MLYAGIDEAGLGPALGPLCQACIVTRVPSGWNAADIWGKESVFTDSRKNTERDRIIVADSKQVYTTGKVRDLERALCFLFIALGADKSDFPLGRETIADFLNCDEDLAEIEALPWNTQTPLLFPGDLTEQCVAQLHSKYQALTGTKFEKAYLAITTAKKLNRLVDAGLNKSEVAQLGIKRMLKSIEESFPGEEIHITIDKQGGRNFYLPFLFDVFPGRWIDNEEESEACSRYCVRGQGNITIEFKAKADSTAFAVAKASMVAKYFRERFMESFNSYFILKKPDLKATAGYHGDAPRFLEQIEDIIDDEKLDRDILVRKK